MNSPETKTSVRSVAAILEGASLNKVLMKTGLLAIVMAVVFSRAIALLVKTWSERDDYSHGFLIPFVSFFLVWSLRSRLASLRLKPNLLIGIPFTLAGCLVLAFGKAGDISVVQQASILIVIPGLVLLLYGGAYLRALLLPLVYLVLMVPVFDAVSGQIHWNAQLLSSAIGSVLLKISGIPVFRNMQFLELPTLTLEVARECSGVNFLLAILAVGVPLSYFTQKTILRKVLLVVMALFVGILANGLRVAIIGVWVYNGNAVVHGPMHMFQGLFVSVVGFIFLFIAAWVLSRIPSGREEPKSLESRSFEPGQVETKSFGRAWVIALVILLASGAFIFQYRPKPVPLADGLHHFPAEIGEWTGAPQAVNRDYGADSEVEMLYRNRAGRELSVYVGYFSEQDQDKKIIGYSQQTNYYQKTEAVNAGAGTGDDFLVNSASVKEGARTSQLYYWYVLDGEPEHSKYRAKFRAAAQGLLHSRTNWALVEVSQPSSSPDGPQTPELQAETMAFMRALMPEVKKILH